MNIVLVFSLSLSLSLCLSRVYRVSPSSPLNLRSLLCHFVFILASARYFLHVSPVNTTSLCDSEMSITTGLVECLAKSFPFLRSSRLRFSCGLVRSSSSSSLSVGVVLGTHGGGTGRDG